MSKKTKFALPLILLVALIAINRYRSSQPENLPYQFNEGTVFGTIYHITYQHDTDLKDEITDTFRKFDYSLSMFNPQSIISGFNRNDSSTVADAYFSTLFHKATEISERTNGAFDLTVAPLVNLWGFGFKNSDTVTVAMVDSILQFVGYQTVSLSADGHLIKQDPRTIIDASSIAKGYSCDVIAQLLASHGVQNYMVEIGGEIAALGINAKGNPWSIGINKPTEDPTSTSQEIENIIHISQGGIATSGNYRKFYYKDGKRYAHTIDPHTGSPVQQDILSSTVIASDCMTADAYATAFMVLGKDKSLEVLQKDTTLMAYFIVSAQDTTIAPYEIVYSPGFEKHLKK